MNLIGNTTKKNTDNIECLITLLKEKNIDYKNLQKFLLELFKKNSHFRDYIRLKYPEKDQKIIDKISVIIGYLQSYDNEEFKNKFGNIENKTKELLELIIL